MALPDLIALVVEAEIGMVGGSATRYPLPEAKTNKNRSFFYPPLLRYLFS
jgi:hypothetical protein